MSSTSARQTRPSRTHSRSTDRPRCQREPQEGSNDGLRARTWGCLVCAVDGPGRHEPGQTSPSPRRPGSTELIHPGHRNSKRTVRQGQCTHRLSVSFSSSRVPLRALLVHRLRTRALPRRWPSSVRRAVPVDRRRASTTRTRPRQSQTPRTRAIPSERCEAGRTARGGWDGQRGGRQLAESTLMGRLLNRVHLGDAHPTQIVSTEAKTFIVLQLTPKIKAYSDMHRHPKKGSLCTQRRRWETGGGESGEGRRAHRTPPSPRSSLDTDPAKNSRQPRPRRRTQSKPDNPTQTHSVRCRLRSCLPSTRTRPRQPRPSPPR